MEHPFPKGTEVYWVKDRKVLGLGTITARQKKRSKSDKRLGFYLYYVSGGGWGGWHHSNDIQPVAQA